MANKNFDDFFTQQNAEDLREVGADLTQPKAKRKKRTIKRVRVNFVLPEDVRDSLDALAYINGQSMTGYIVTLINKEARKHAQEIEDYKRGCK